MNTYGMETNQNFTDILRLLAHSVEHPDPCSSPLSDIADLGDQTVPQLVKALTHDDPIIRRGAVHALGQLRSPVEDRLDLQPAAPHLETIMETDIDVLAPLTRRRGPVVHHQE